MREKNGASGNCVSRDKGGKKLWCEGRNGWEGAAARREKRGGRSSGTRAEKGSEEHQREGRKWRGEAAAKREKRAVSGQHHGGGGKGGEWRRHEGRKGWEVA